jgi:hypothetical protein
MRVKVIGVTSLACQIDLSYTLTEVRLNPLKFIATIQQATTVEMTNSCFLTMILSCMIMDNIVDMSMIVILAVREGCLCQVRFNFVLE